MTSLCRQAVLIDGLGRVGFRGLVTGLGFVSALCMGSEFSRFSTQAWHKQGSCTGVWEFRARG